MREWINPFICIKFNCFWRYIEGKAKMTLMGLTDTLEHFKLCEQCQTHIENMAQQMITSLRKRLGDKAYNELKNCGLLSNMIFHEIDGAVGIRIAYEEAVKSEY